MAGDESDALRAQIAALSGQISAHRAGAAVAPQPPPHYAARGSWRGRGAGYSYGGSGSGSGSGSTNGFSRGGYYSGASGRGRGRGGGTAASKQWSAGAGVRNKTLVLNQQPAASGAATTAGATASTSTAGPAAAVPTTAASLASAPSASLPLNGADPGPSSAPVAPAPVAFVKRNERGSMSLVTSETYKKLEAARAAHVAAKAQPTPKAATQPIRKVKKIKPAVRRGDKMGQVIVDGVIFEFDESGKNLVKKGSVPTSSPDLEHAPPPRLLRRSATAAGRTPLAAARRRKGNLTYTPTAKLDPAKLPLCPRVLSPQGCTLQARGKTCPLSHTPTPHRVPHCAYYTRRRFCRNSTQKAGGCVYTHSDRVSPDTPQCEDFAGAGYCERGAECERRHTFECAEFEATGTCSKPKCRRMHVVRVKASSAGPPTTGGDGAADDDFVFERDDAAAFEEDEAEAHENGDAGPSARARGKRKRAEDAGDDDDMDASDAEDLSGHPRKKHIGKSFIKQQDYISFGDDSGGEDEDEEEGHSGGEHEEDGGEGEIHDEDDDDDDGEEDEDDEGDEDEDEDETGFSEPVVIFEDDDEDDEHVRQERASEAEESEDEAALAV